MNRTKMALTAVLLLFAIVMILLLLSLRTIAVTGVPVVAASEEMVRTALDLLDLKDGERLCELGCGFGGVIRAARARADVSILAFELNPAVAAVAALRSLGDRRVRVRIADVRSADFGRPDALYMFLMPGMLAQIDTVLERQLPDGARIASVDFEVPGWIPAESRHCRGGHTIFLYVAGRHRAPRPAAPDAASAPEERAE